MTDADAIVIRAEQAGDEAAIAALTEAAFALAEHASGSEAAIIAALRACGALHVSLVSCAGDVIIGHVAITPVRIGDGSDGWYGLGPISVAPRWQRMGIGTRLVDAALDRLRGERAQGCVVLGDPRWYARLGFQHTAQLRFPAAPAEYFMAQAFTDAAACGEVRYYPAFDP